MNNSKGLPEKRHLPTDDRVIDAQLTHIDAACRDVSASLVTVPGGNVLAWRILPVCESADDAPVDGQHSQFYISRGRTRDRERHRSVAATWVRILRE